MIPSAQLWIGSPEHLLAHATNYLQERCCTKKGCQKCQPCKNIEAQQHPQIMWLTTEKLYTVDQMDTILHTCTFALEPNQFYFFVLQKADFLSTACANRLLKIVEEPPPGYHFIFLAERLSAILPTIKSRCIIKQFNTLKTTAAESGLRALFQQPKMLNPATFLKLLEQENPHEQTTLDMIDGLLHYWLRVHKQKSADNSAMTMVELLTQALHNPPMPGGSKIFWRNFYLQVKNQV